MKRWLARLLTLTMVWLLLCGTASAKTDPDGQTVGTTLFYLTNSSGAEILVSHITVAEMAQDLADGKLDSTNHNYSLLDRYVTTVHQEAQGFTVPDYVAYAQEKSTVPALRALNLSYGEGDSIAFWEIDQTGYDAADTYSYAALYGEQRYNFPLLYEYWDYRKQDYADPAGKLTREQVIEQIFSRREPEMVLLSVYAYSQRYMASDLYGSGSYNMENLWYSSGRMDTARAIRIMKPMTERELREKTPTASDTRYWVANIRLDMGVKPDVQPLGAVAAPQAVMTEDEEYYYISFSCDTKGAVILYNHNFGSPSYTPTCEYTGAAVKVPKSAFPDGTVTMTCRAVRDGYTDAGVQTLKLTASGKHPSYADVDEKAWYAANVHFVTENGLFDSMEGNLFAPEAPMTRAMLATALYRMAGSPETAGIAGTPFADVASDAAYADAVAWCYEAQVVNGTGAAAFSPENTITREQLVTMFCRYAERVAAADMSVSDSLERFTDRGRLSAYAVNSMQWAVAAGLISGMTDTTIVPQGTATRAQAAAMVQRLAAFVTK